ncbi:MAG TPA: GDP-L-fucose synthase [Thermoanaerobaculia bacterium]
MFVAGHRGMVGSAMVRALTRAGYTNLLTAPRESLDLRDRRAVAEFFRRERPEVVILSAAKVGGINANRLLPAEFLYDNLIVQTNVIDESRLAGVKLLVFLGSSCIYPRECPQPMKEEYLLTGPLEPTNEAYALAKIAGLRMAYYYEKQYGMRVVCPMPTNLYGTNDNFDPQNSHVLSALVKKFSDAADAGADRVTVWGSGTARREFLHVDDAARGILLLMEQWHSPEIINLGVGEDITIRELAQLIAAKAGFTDAIDWDTSMPDGMPRKLLDVSKIAALGFKPEIALEEGIERTIAEYRARRDQA